ncbi:Uncharacterised protein [Legionella pneumophila]|nr:hypothetical protein [Legionella pneumophila subsp. pneumophila]CZG97203.1 Uncharacterised protein [Legionella pneumophila]CZG97486.1 Uncharacterised protein [Legionella pneumophila]CZH19017.1 Uncharacterised protein [Legionella pneumophila]CZH43929.1 Uncharacterised protein [Legionella pneumophila]
MATDEEDGSRVNWRSFYFCIYPLPYEAVEIIECS